MKKNIITTVAGLVLLASLLLSGCGNVLSPSFPQPAAENGKGNVTVSFSAGRAALMPSLLDFDVYVFAFTKEGDGTTIEETRNKNQAFTFSLDVDETYTLEVKAYKGSVHEDNIGASGSSAPFTVLASGTLVPVTLNGYLTEGVNGTFSYNIQFPIGTDIDKLELYLDESTSIDLLDGAFLGDNGISNSVPADAGRYLLIVWLSKGGEETEDYNGVTIYSNTTTYYGTETTPVVFKNSDFWPMDEGERVYYWHEFDVEGSREFYNMYHYESSNAIGTRFETYVDDTGTYEDVLKLEPPDPSGYVLRSMMLTRPISKAGTYRLSMDYLVEKGEEDVNFFWYSTGGIHGDAGGWPIVVGTTAYMQAEDFGKWLHMEGTFEFWWDDDEIGIIARNNNDAYGLRDATIYIRNLILEDENGELPPIVSSVSVNPASLTLVINNSRQLKANKPVTWTVDPQGVVTVGSEGLVTAIGLGSAVITATSTEDPEDYATVAVKVIEERSRYIALSFDDGPNSHFTPLFMKVLDDYAAHATFFCTGAIDGAQQLAKEMVAAGHEIGNHTWNHTMNLQMQPLQEVINELDYTSTTIFNITGQRPKVFRAPALLYNTPYPNYDLFVDWEVQFGGNYEEACRQLGMSLIDASFHQIGNYDWDAAYSAEAIFEHAKTLVRDWGILLFHDSSDRALDALPMILQYLADEGFNVCTASEVAEKRQEDLGIPWGLEPGRIYYDFVEMPEHTGSLTLTNGGEAAASTVYVDKGDTLNLSAVVQPSGAQPLYWYSTNENVAMVDDGTVTVVGNGASVVRAVSGGMRAEMTLIVGPPPEEWKTLTAWDVFEYPHDYTTVNGELICVPSGAGEELVSGFTPGDGYSYENVLKIFLEDGDEYNFENGVGGGLAMIYPVPFDGEYRLSMDVWIERADSGANPDLLWYECFGGWSIFINESDVKDTGWLTLEGTINYINSGAYIGFETMSWIGDSGFWGASIYIRDLKLELMNYSGETISILDIQSTAADEALPSTEPQGIILEWADGQVPLSAVISGSGSQDPLTGNIAINQGSSVTITPQGSFTDYEWRMGKDVVGDGKTYVFEGAVTGEYKILLWVDERTKGATINIAVE